MNRDNGKQLVQGPMIRHRTKDREVGQILGAQQTAKFVKLFSDILRLLSVLVGPFTNVPEKYLALGAIFQTDEAEIEKRKQLFAVFKRVVVILSIILDRDRFAQTA